MLGKISKFLNVALIVILILAVGIIMLVTFSPVKKYQLLRVMSGSMEPAIKTGSIVFVGKANVSKLEAGDIVNYKSKNDPNVTITHRLVKIEETDGKKLFMTKGDANNTPDTDQVAESQISGKVVFTLPYLGFLSSWLKKPHGLVLLVIVPAILVIVGEMFNIKKTIEENVREKMAREQYRPSEYTTQSAENNSAQKNIFPKQPAAIQQPRLNRPKKRII